MTRYCLNIPRRTKRDSIEQTTPNSMESPEKENKQEAQEEGEVPDSPTKSENYFSRKFGSLLNRSKRKFKKQDSHDTSSQNGDSPEKSPASSRKPPKKFFKRTKSLKNQDSVDAEPKQAEVHTEPHVDNGDLESLEHQEDQSKRRMTHTKYSEQREVLVHGKALREVEVTGEKPGGDGRKQRRLSKKKSTDVNELAVSCRQLGTADFEGWLFKKSGGSALTPVSWKKCWCVLKNGALYLYKTSFDQSALHVYHLKNYSFIHVPEEKRKCSFKIQPKNVSKEALVDAKAIVFATESEIEVDKWSEALQKASQGIPVTPEKDSLQVLTTDRRRCFTTGNKPNKPKSKENGEVEAKPWRPRSSSFAGDETTGMPTRSGSTSGRGRKISNTGASGVSVLAVGSMFRPIDNPDEDQRHGGAGPTDENTDVDLYKEEDGIPGDARQPPVGEEKLPDVVESTLEKREDNNLETTQQGKEDEKPLDVRKEIERLESQSRIPEAVKAKDDGDQDDVVATTGDTTEQSRLAEEVREGATNAEEPQNISEIDSSAQADVATEQRVTEKESAATTPTATKTDELSPVEVEGTVEKSSTQLEAPVNGTESKEYPVEPEVYPVEPEVHPVEPEVHPVEPEVHPVTTEEVEYKTEDGDEKETSVEEESPQVSEKTNKDEIEVLAGECNESLVAEEETKDQEAAEQSLETVVHQEATAISSDGTDQVLKTDKDLDAPVSAKDGSELNTGALTENADEATVATDDNREVKEEIPEVEPVHKKGEEISANSVSNSEVQSTENEEKVDNVLEVMPSGNVLEDKDVIPDNMTSATEVLQVEVETSLEQNKAEEEKSKEALTVEVTTHSFTDRSTMEVSVDSIVTEEPHAETHTPDQEDRQNEGSDAKEEPGEDETKPHDADADVDENQSDEAEKQAKVEEGTSDKSDVEAVCGKPDQEEGSVDNMKEKAEENNNVIQTKPECIEEENKAETDHQNLQQPEEKPTDKLAEESSVQNNLTAVEEGITT